MPIGRNTLLVLPSVRSKRERVRICTPWLSFEL